ncbi:MAG: diacylglycerol kinase family protein [Bacillota bacterium]|uniref:diacylglycerol kinase family protein n=1 Tax=Desulfurispora thermophila TaxID=265470 RepID=UPI00036B9BB6|nr:diacylglycerol kinase family protein [Desulfurispora thermophila]
MSSKFLRSLFCALRGIGLVVATQRHMRFHLLATLVVLVVAWWLGLSGLRLVVLLLVIFVVLSAELINTALERVVDLVSPQYHPLARDAKDIAAGAVLLLAALAVLVGLLVLGPPLWFKFVRLIQSS